MADNSLGAKVGVPVVLPNLPRPTLFAATSSSGFGTVTGNLVQQIMGEGVRITGVITSGTVTASAARLTLPNGWTLTPTNGTNPVVGRWYRNAISAGSTRKGGSIFIAGTGNGFVSFGSDDYTTANSPSSAELVGNGIVGSSEAFTVDFTIYPDQLVGQGSLAYGAGQATSVKVGLVSAEESGSFSVATSGPAAPGSFMMYYVRVGKQVTLTLDPVTQASIGSGAYTLNLVNMPASIRPVILQELPALIAIDNSANQASPGWFRLPTTGNANIFKNAAATSFGATGNVGWLNFSVTYRSA